MEKLGITSFRNRLTISANDYFVDFIVRIHFLYEVIIQFDVNER